MQFGLSLVLATGLLAGSLAPAAALPMFGGPAVAPAPKLEVQPVYYRCGYYGCRRRAFYYRPAYRYYRPYGYGYYRRPGIGIGIGPLGIGVY